MVNDSKSWELDDHNLVLTEEKGSCVVGPNLAGEQWCLPLLVEILDFDMKCDIINKV